LAAQLRKSPGNPEAYLALAEAQMKAGKVDRALSTFRAVKAIAPDNIRVLRLGARIYEALGRKDEAISSWGACLKVDGRDIDAALQTARLLFDTGRRRKALDILERLRSTARHFPDILLRMAEIRLSLNDPAGAQQDVSMFKSLSGKTLEMFSLLGRSMLLQDFFDGAVKTFREGLEDYPNSPDLLMGLGKALLELGEKGQALLEFERAFQFAPDNVEILLEMGRLYGRMGLEDKMEEAFQRIRHLENLNGDAFLGMARLLKERRQLPEALSDLERARQLSPHHPEIVKLYGEILEERREYARAVAEYEAFLQGTPGIPWALEGIIRCAGYLRDFPRVFHAQERIIQGGMKTPDTWCDLGETLIRLNKFDEATIAFEEASKLDPTCVRAYQAPELIKIEKARSEGEKLVQEAKEAIAKKFWLTATDKLERALYLVPREFSWLKLLAEVNLKTGALDQAADRLSRVRAREPHDFWVASNLARVYEHEDKIQLAGELLAAILKDHPQEMAAQITLIRLKRHLIQGQRVGREMVDAMVKSVQADFASNARKGPIGRILEGFIHYILAFGTRFQAESFQHAENLFRGIVDENPDLTWPFLGLSLINRSRGEVKKAAIYLQELVKLSADPEALFSLARLFENFQSFAEAEKFYLSLRNLIPENGFYRKKAIEMMAKDIEPGRTDRLNDFLMSRQNDLRKESNPTWTFFEIGWAQMFLARRGNDRDEWAKKALLTWNKAVSAPEVSPWTRWGLLEAQIEFLRGAEKVRALNQQLKICEKIARELPELAFSHSYLGLCYLGFEDLAQTDRAVKYLETAVFLDPRHPELWFLLGRAYRSIGKSSRVDAVKNNMLLLEPETAIKL
jgi:tetratricopeptide (TPR) repeat protein